MTSADVARLSKQFQLLTKRPPNEDELEGLVQRLIREEVLYREAVSLGLDQDDTIVRRRMVQKMEFLSSELAKEAEPTETELQAWLDANPEKYPAPRTTRLHACLLQPRQAQGSGAGDG